MRRFFEFFGKNGADDGEGVLRESNPVHEVSVVLDVLDTDGKAMEFTMGRDQRDVRGLDLRDRVERCRGLSNGVQEPRSGVPLR